MIPASSYKALPIKCSSITIVSMVLRRNNVIKVRVCIMMQACGKIAARSAISIAQSLIVECSIIYAYNNASSSYIYTVVVSFSSTTGLSAQHLAMMW